MPLVDHEPPSVPDRESRGDPVLFDKVTIVGLAVVLAVVIAFLVWIVVV